MRFYDYVLRFKDTGGAASLRRLQSAAGGVKSAVSSAGEKATAVFRKVRSDVAEATTTTGKLKAAFQGAGQVGEAVYDRLRAAARRYNTEAEKSPMQKRGADGRFLPGSGKGGAGGGGFSMGGLMRGAAVGALLYGAAAGVRDVASQQGMDNAIRFSGGKDGARNLAFVSESASRLGLDLLSAKEGFKTLSGSMMGTSLAGEGTRKLFEQAAGATTVMGLSGDDQKGVFLALGQIMSKGKVAAEELRGQIGERLPGAFKIAADAMGVSQAKLNKMMQDGKVSSADFLPKFGAQLEKVFGPGLANATNSLQANLNRFDSLWLRTKTNLITSILPGVTWVMNSVTFLAGHLEPLKQELRGVWQETQPIRDAFQRLALMFGLTGNSSQMMTALISRLAGVMHRVAPIGAAIGRVMGAAIDLVGRLGKVFMRVLGGDNMQGILDVVMGTFSVISNVVSRAARGIGQVLNGISRGSIDQVMTGVKTLGSSITNLPRYVRQAEREIARSKLFKGETAKDGAKKLLDKGGKSAGADALGANPDLQGGIDKVSGTEHVRNITVNIGKFQDAINIHTSTLKESAGQVVSNLEEWMVRSVAGAEAALSG